MFEEKQVPEKIVRIVIEIYRRASTIVKTVSGDSQLLRVEVGLHQSFALTPVLFVTVIDMISDNIRDKDWWKLLFAEDLVLTGMLEWEDCLERLGMKVNAMKTELVMFSKTGAEWISIADRRGEELKQVDKFE